MRPGLAAMLLILLSSCHYRHKKPDHVYDKRLTNFKSLFIYDADQVDTLDKNIYQRIIADTLNSKTDTIKYLRNSIYISCLVPTPGCADYNGDVEFNKDTIKLLLINTLPYNCSDRNVWRVIYTISNSGNKHYMIKKH